MSTFFYGIGWAIASVTLYATIMGRGDTYVARGYATAAMFFAIACYEKLRTKP